MTECDTGGTSPGSEKMLSEIATCTNCEVCLDVCPTYKATGQRSFSPIGRLEGGAKIFEGRPVDSQIVESIYNCPKCMLCEAICPQGIEITRVVHEARKELVHRGAGPLEKHEQVIRGIMTTGNSVNRDPARRLDWLPEEFARGESETLLFLGCLPSYLVKDAAASTYLVLKNLGVDFMILEDEGCCGTYIYEAGRVDLAGELFQRNIERFRSLGVTSIIVPCNGCLKCFKYFYPDVLGRQDIEVHHVMEIIDEKLKKGSSLLRKIPNTVTYQDSCRLSRGEGLIEEARELLRSCGADIQEPHRKGGEALCCGAGAGIRSVYRDLSKEMASEILDQSPADLIVSACPFCVFNLGYTSHKKGLGKKVVYFTSLILDSLEKRSGRDSAPDL